jgi:ergothioneine biosynthesis protein EgtB
MTPEAIDTFRRRFRDAWQRSDRIFDLVPREHWLDQPIELRHPILFYVGHLPAFAWNQVGRGLLGWGALHPEYDELFERGIDPVDGDRHDASVEWPSIDEVLAYRDRTRERLLEAVEAVAARSDGYPLAARGRILNVALEHELMHQETLQYMYLQLEPGVLRRPDDLPPYRFDGNVPAEAVAVDGGEVVLGADYHAVDFGWDNEFPEHRVAVDGLRIDRTPVTVGAWLDFVEAGGYRRAELWLEGDWRWRQRVGLEHPPRWRRDDGAWRYRTLFDALELERVRSWPVAVSLAEARAFCRWRGVRLPTEAELHRAMYGSSDGPRRHPWGDDEPRPGVHGNFDFANWSPTPVADHPAGESAWGLLDTVGNLWEWTSSRFAGFPGFEVTVPSYPGYSAAFFDDRHFVMLGASWATPTPLVRRSFRNWFQDRYPYAFAGFRTVHPR